MLLDYVKLLKKMLLLCLQPRFLNWGRERFIDGCKQLATNSILPEPVNQVFKIWQNHYFLDSDKKIFGKSQNFSDGEIKNLGKIRNFRRRHRPTAIIDEDFIF